MKCFQPIAVLALVSLMTSSGINQASCSSIPASERTQNANLVFLLRIA